MRPYLAALPREERVKLCLLNPALFGEYYIKPYTRKWNTDTADHHYYMLECVMVNQNVVIHVPIEHAKSTWMSLVLPLWFIYRDRNTQGALISNTARQAQGFMARVKWHIEYNPLLKEDFLDYVTPNKNEKWTDEQIFVVRDESEQSKDPTILALGTGGALLGARLEWVIADDILDLGNTQTQHMREKVENWWYEIVDSRVIDGGRRIVLGTLQHRFDLLCKLSEDPTFKYIHLAALDENENALWPNQWPRERILEKKSSIGTIRWLKVMQNDRTASTGKLLDPGWLKFYGPLRGKLLPPMRELQVFIGIDPAIADDKQSAEERELDYFALAVVGFHKQEKLAFLIETFQEHLTFPEQLKVIDRYYLKYKKWCKKIGIEEVAFQKALKQQAFLLDSLPPVVGVKVGTQSKAARMETFGVYSETGRFWILDEHQDFISEWVDYEPGGRSPNILDACNTAMTMITNPGSYVSDSDRELMQSIRVV
jgi:hypothetical protein